MNGLETDRVAADAQSKNGAGVALENRKLNHEQKPATAFTESRERCAAADDLPMIFDELCVLSNRDVVCSCGVASRYVHLETRPKRFRYENWLHAGFPQSALLEARFRSLLCRHISAGGFCGTSGFRFDLVDRASFHRRRLPWCTD